jgi:hypothetical protein
MVHSGKHASSFSLLHCWSFSPSLALQKLNKAKWPAIVRTAGQGRPAIVPIYQLATKSRCDHAT